MTVRLEVIQKSRPDLVDAAHVHPIGGLGRVAKNALSAGQTLLDKACPGVQKLCSQISRLPQYTKPVDSAFAALTGLPGACFLPTGSTTVTSGETGLVPAPKEQPPRKLSGKRTLVI